MNKEKLLTRIKAAAARLKPGQTLDVILSKKDADALTKSHAKQEKKLLGKLLRLQRNPGVTNSQINKFYEHYHANKWPKKYTKQVIESIIGKYGSAPLSDRENEIILDVISKPIKPRKKRAATAKKTEVKSPRARRNPVAMPDKKVFYGVDHDNNRQAEILKQSYKEDFSDKTHTAYIVTIWSLNANKSHYDYMRRFDKLADAREYLKNKPYTFKKTTIKNPRAMRKYKSTYQEDKSHVKPITKDEKLLSEIEKQLFKLAAKFENLKSAAAKEKLMLEYKELSEIRNRLKK